jgi:hypothetical protein
VANSIVYRLLDSLIEKGLASYITKEKTKHFQAVSPEKIVGYIEERKEKLDKSKEEILKALPMLAALQSPESESRVFVYEDFEACRLPGKPCTPSFQKVKNTIHGASTRSKTRNTTVLAARPHKETEAGHQGKILFNQGTPQKILKNRNSYKLMDARYMTTSIKTPAWFAVFKDTTLITVQEELPICVVIENKLIADSFDAYFRTLEQNQTFQVAEELKRSFDFHAKMAFEITMLGTSCMVPTKERNVQAIFVDFKGDGMLFDCGEGTQRQRTSQE